MLGLMKPSMLLDFQEPGYMDNCAQFIWIRTESPDVASHGLQCLNRICWQTERNTFISKIYQPRYKGSFQATTIQLGIMNVVLPRWWTNVSDPHSWVLVLYPVWKYSFTPVLQPQLLTHSVNKLQSTDHQKRQVEWQNRTQIIAPIHRQNDSLLFVGSKKMYSVN